MIKTHILIVGGGISGLSIAYNLVKKGVNDILVVDRSYLGAGSTGRCATGIRSSFTSEEHVALMKRSIELWKEYSEGELGEYGLYYDQGGYVWIASREETLDLFRKLERFHNTLGVPTRVVEDLEVLRELVPTINVGEVVGALFDPTAGKSYPFDTLYALYKFLKTNNVDVKLRVRVEGFMVKNGRVVGAKTSSGIVEADKVVVCAGSGSRSLLKTLGVELPLKNMPRHVLLTEAYKPVFKPLVIDWDTKGVPYIVQTRDGNFFIGRDVDEEPELSLYSQRIDFMGKALKPIARLFPWIRNVNVLRYWIGYYVMTPDHHPIYGPIPGYENLYVATGFSGHGYMMGPVTGEVISEWIINDKPSIVQAYNLTLERFEKGALIKEYAVVG